MKYLYILDDNNVCTEIRNIYPDDDIDSITNGREYLILDEFNSMNGYKFINNDFVKLEQKAQHRITDNDIILSKILLDLQYIKDRLGGL